MGKEPRYKLKKTLLHTEKFGIVNQANCTDEKAIALLAISSGHLKHFEVYPDDWDKDVTKARNPKKVKAAKPTPDQVAEEKIVNQEAEELAPDPVANPEPAAEKPGVAYREKLIAMNGIAEATADKIITVFGTEAELEAHIASGKDLEFTAQANKALLANYEG